MIHITYFIAEPDDCIAKNQKKACRLSDKLSLPKSCYQLILRSVNRISRNRFDTLVSAVMAIFSCMKLTNR